MFSAKDFLTREGEYLVSDGAQKINRADVARFMIKVAEEGTFVKKTVAMTVQA